MKYHNSNGNDCSNQDSDEVDVMLMLVDEELAIVMNEEADSEAFTLSCFFFLLLLPLVSLAMQAMKLMGLQDMARYLAETLQVERAQKSSTKCM